MSHVSAFKMIKRRAPYLRNGGAAADSARATGHESTCTTQLYSRMREEISLDEIDRGSHETKAAHKPHSKWNTGEKLISYGTALYIQSVFFVLVVGLLN